MALWTTPSGHRFCGDRKLHPWARVTLSPSCSEEDISKKAHRKEKKVLGNSASFSVLAFIDIHFNNKVFKNTEEPWCR